MTSTAPRRQDEIRPIPPYGKEAGGLAGLAPVGRWTVQDRVYDTLRQSLIRGQFDAGEVLRIHEVAQRMSTSTMPVREALGRLVSEQALEPMPNRSVRVPLIAAARLDDLVRARSLIEGELVALALPRLTPTDLAELRGLTDAYDSLTGGRIQTARQVADLNHAFHFLIYKAAGSPVLIPIVESLWMQSGPYVRAAASLFDTDTDGPATSHHRAVIDAIEAADVAAARTALRADIGRAFDLLRARPASIDPTGNGGGDG
ncbi:MAG: GntR family transcriptional regulator [Inquilinaceae bacterium]